MTSTVFLSPRFTNMSDRIFSNFTGFTPGQLHKLILKDQQLVLVDTRSAVDFTEGFIPGALFLGIEGRFVEWALNLLSADTPICLVTSAGKETYCAGLLRDAGFTHVVGFLEGGFEAWKDFGGTTDMIINIDAGELAMDIPFDENLVIVDIRRPVEYAEGHVQYALNLPLDEMKDPVNIANLNEKDNLYLHCASGYRSVIAASLLKIQGYHNIRNITGGWESIKHTKGITAVKEPGALN